MLLPRWLRAEIGIDASALLRRAIESSPVILTLHGLRLKIKGFGFVVVCHGARYSIDVGLLQDR